MTETTTPSDAGAAAAPHAPIATPKTRLRKTQGIASDQFFYFYLRLRKGEVRRVAQRVQELYPGETPEQWARRLINAQSSLTFLSGVLIHLPLLFPVTNTLVKFAGLVGGASVLTRLHLYLILEIALLYGKDIDDQARIAEMMAVVAASGITASTPFLLNALDWAPAVAIPTSGLTAAVATRLIGEAAIALYSRETVPRLAESAAVSAAAPA